MLQVVKSIGIIATGVLTVTVTPDKAKWYVPENVRVAVGWSPVSGMLPCEIAIDWGDGIVEEYMSPYPTSYIHKYSVGSYTVKATVFDVATGATGSGPGSLQVAEQLAVSFTADKTSGTIPLTVTFSGTNSKGYTPYSWVIDYGDGSATESGTGATVSKTHTYNKVGTFSAKLTVTDALGASLSWMLEIGAGIPPELIPWLEVAAASIPLLVVVITIAAQELKRVGVG